MVTKATVMMKRIFLYVLFLLSCDSVFAVPAIVDRVLDGDTFAARVELQDGIKITVRVRLLDIDTPEINGKCQFEIDMANKARDRTAELLPIGSVIELSEIKDDKYLGRIDAKVILPDGRNLSEILLDENLGRLYDGGQRSDWCK